MLYSAFKDGPGGNAPIPTPTTTTGRQISTARDSNNKSSTNTTANKNTIKKNNKSATKNPALSTNRHVRHAQQQLQQLQQHQHAFTVPPKRGKQLNETRKGRSFTAATAAAAAALPATKRSTGSNYSNNNQNNSKGLQIYSLSKLVADVKSSGGKSGRTAATISRSKEVNSLAAAATAFTKTTTSIKRTIPSTREEQPRKRSPEDVLRHLNITKKTNELRAQDIWERFRESKLEKMRLHKLNVEQRMRDNGEADNYNYYWDNINHCYSNSNQTNSRGAGARKQGQGQCKPFPSVEQSLPASWYTDNIYSNWSIDLDEQEDANNNNNNNHHNNNMQNLVPSRTRNVDRRRNPGQLRNRNSCDINGNSPYKMHGFHGFEEGVDEAATDDTTGFYDYNNNGEFVDSFRVHLKPTTPTKYGYASSSSNRVGVGGCAFANNNHSGAEEEVADEFFDRYGGMRMPKSKSFGQEPEKSRKMRDRFGLGASFLWQGRRSKTTNLLMDIQSKFRRDGKKDIEKRLAGDKGGSSDAMTMMRRNHFYNGVLMGSGGGDNGRNEYAGGGFRDNNDRKGLRNRSMDDDIYRPRSRRRTRFNFQQNLLLNSEDDDEDEANDAEEEDGDESDLGFHRDHNNNCLQQSYGHRRDHPSESYYHHRHEEPQQLPIKGTTPLRPTSLNLNGGRFNRGRSLDEYYEYNYPGNLNYIDKNLNIVNFLNSARNIPQEFHAEAGVGGGGCSGDGIVTEQIFNPNIEYRTPKQHEKNKIINRMRNFSSLDLDWETGERRRMKDSILERTSAIFGNLIDSPQSSPVDVTGGDNDIIMLSCPGVDPDGIEKPYLSFISDPEPMPKKSCMKKPTTMKNSSSDFVIHKQALDYQLNSYYPQEEFNEPPLLIDCHPHEMEGPVGGDADVGRRELRGEEPEEDHEVEDLIQEVQGVDEEADEELHLTGNKFGLLSDDESHCPDRLDPSTLHIINNIFSIYKPNQYSPVNCHNPTLDNLKVDNYSKKISLPSTMRPLGEPMAGQSNIDMDEDGFLLHDQNNNRVIHDAYDDCFVEGPSAIIGGNRRRKSTFFASLKRPLMVVKSKSCHDSVAASDDHWFCSGDLSGGKWNKNLSASSSTNLLNALTSPTDSNNSLLEKTGLFKFSPTSTTETSYFYPFDCYFNAATAVAAAAPSYTGTKKKSLMLRSTTRPLSFSH